MLYEAVKDETARPLIQDEAIMDEAIQDEAARL